ncbi:MAG: hypothetical protein E7583_05035 [Ruminococcaceae bacterium]|nr:hypothetical protein [Oscillospiraceae bacterium]
MKKLTGIVFAVILGALMCVCAMAKDYGNVIDKGECGKYGDNVIWTMYDSGTLVISGEGEMEDYADYIGTTTAPYSEYLENKKVRSLIIEPGVTVIGIDAFSCRFNVYPQIENIEIADTVTKIYRGAFSELYFNDYNYIPSSVTHLGIGNAPGDHTDWWKSQPNGLVYLGTAAVGYKSIGGKNIELKIKDGTTVVAMNALANPYENHELLEYYKKLYIPASVKGISGLYGCTNLEIEIDPENPYLCKDEYGVIYSADMTKLMYAPAKNWYGEYTIPDTVTEIVDGAFQCCNNLYTINIGKGVTRIGDSAFENCDSLSFVTIPENVRHVGHRAFYDCDKLAVADILYGTHTVGEFAFYSCDSLLSISLPNSLKCLGNCVVRECPLLKVFDIPESVEKIVNIHFSPSGGGIFFGGNDSLETFMVPYNPDIPGDGLWGWLIDFNDWVEQDRSKYDNLKYVYIKNAYSEELLEIERFEKGGLPHHTQVIRLYAGNAITNYLATDIKATIDGAPIRSYNIDGYTVIIAEDLRNYGFNVVYNDDERTLRITEGTKEITSTYEHTPHSGSIGDIAGDVYYTDIDTYFFGKTVKSFNIGGYTAIYISDLSSMGLVEWKETDREISFVRY